MTKNIFTAVFVLFCLATQAGQQFKFGNQTLTVPYGFEVELVASTNLVARPISGSFDEQGRLYVTDSSGSNENVNEQLKHPNHRVLRLEDTDGDGKFDSSVVFADKMMFPEGCLWHDGSLYVSAPPSIWKLTDTNNDGYADVREEWHKGKTLTGCANDLHGPYLGPDGWIYWCKGATAEQTYEVNGKPWKSRASHIFRARPDGSRLEPVMTGGMDNPVGLAFTSTGERILCGTFFAPDEPGHRDGLIHAIYGGVYGKQSGVLDGHKRTGDLMPVMTHMGAAAPCAVIRYKSGVFDEEYRDNLFCCQFNLHKVSRHILAPGYRYHGYEDATFKTKDSDFLVSNSTDFHPTDVIEDADGSLLVIDTGAWYKLCCPTSQLGKPDVLGAIYRIRRLGATKITDPRGIKIPWNILSPTNLVEYLSAERPAVVERAIQELAKRRKASVSALAETLTTSQNFDARLNSVWALTRIDSTEARKAVYLALPKSLKELELEERIDVCQSAVYSIALWRDRELFQAVNHPLWNDLLEHQFLDLQDNFTKRLISEAFGRFGIVEPRVINYLLTQCHRRLLDHSAAFALIELNQPELTRVGLTNYSVQRNSVNSTVWTNWFTARHALIALDQMNSGDLKPAEVLPFLKGGSPEVRQTAAWVAGHHPEWGSELAGFFRERLAASDLKDYEQAELEKQLVQFAGNTAIQQLIAESLSAEATPRTTRQLLLRVMSGVRLKEVPRGWAEGVRAALDDRVETVVRPAMIAAGALGRLNNGAPGFADQLQRIALDTIRPDDLRLEALSALPRGFGPIETGLLTFLCDNLAYSKPVAMRSAAISALTRLKLSDDQMLALADALKSAGPMEVSRLLPAFEQSTNEVVGLRLIGAMKESIGLAGLNSGALKATLEKYPQTVQTNSTALIALLNVDEAKQRAHLEELVATLPKGDIRGGQAIFNSTRTACSSCHQIGYLGGKVGPNLSNIGSVRTERDLLEAIVYPSASFVRSFEPCTVLTKGGDDYSGVLKKDSVDEVILATGPNAEVRLARADIAEMRPGKVSVMPSGLADQLSKQELADLVAFLKVAK